MINIRLMNHDEVEKVRNLMHKTLSQNCKKEYKNSNNTFVVVADINGEICGAATIYVHEDELVGQKDYFISNLCVEYKLQRQGIATQIIKYIEEKAITEEVKYVYTLVPIKREETTKLYNKLKYELRNISCFRKEI